MATLEELRHAVRKDADDLTPPYLAAEEDVDRGLNNAVTEACIRTRALQDDTSSVCRIQLITGISRYRINPAIMAVRAALLPSSSRPLIRTTTKDLDRREPGWQHMPEKRTVGDPRYIVNDVGTKTIELWPPPQAATILNLRVWRMPLDTERMEDEEDEPAIVLPDPESLKHWALFELYSQKDSELEDAARAQTHYQLFTAIFGERPTAQAMQSWAVDKPPSRRMQSDF